MHTIHPAQSQYHAHSRPPPPSNSTASSPSRPTPAQQPQQNTKDPVTVVGVPSVTVEYNQLIVGDARTCQSTPPPLPDFLLTSSPSLFSPLPYFSINTHLHPSQGRWRWIVRNGVAV